MKIRVNKIKGELLTKRPEKMDYETYRATRKAQEKQIKQRIRRGYIVWPSKGLPGQLDGEGKLIQVQSKGTLVGSVPELIFV